MKQLRISVAYMLNAVEAKFLTYVELLQCFVLF